MTQQTARASEINRKLIKEQLILGMDPGTSVMGYGVIKVKKPTIQVVQYGVIHLSKYKTHELKLKKYP